MLRVVFGVVLSTIGAIPATDAALADDRVHVTVPRVAFEVLIAIPFGMVVRRPVRSRSGTRVGAGIDPAPSGGTIQLLCLVGGTSALTAPDGVGQLGP